jgi:hypothetical protein
MNEPKKRGRPSKADIAAREVAPTNDIVAAPDVVLAAPYSDAVMRAAAELKRDVAPSAAQHYANRVWASQSESLSRHERLGRVADALKAQGLSMEGVEL